MSWVRRIAAAVRECSSCWDVIPEGREYYLMADGERLCQDCPPEEDASCTV